VPENLPVIVRRLRYTLGWSALATAVLTATLATAACDPATTSGVTSGGGSSGTSSPGPLSGSGSGTGTGPGSGASARATFTPLPDVLRTLTETLLDSTYTSLGAKIHVVTGTDGRTTASDGTMGISVTPPFTFDTATPAGGGTYSHVTLGDGTTCSTTPDGKQQVTNGTAPLPSTALKFFDNISAIVAPHYLTPSAPPLGAGPATSIVIQGTMPTASTPAPGVTVQQSTMTLWVAPTNGHIVASEAVLKYTYTTGGAQHTQSQDTLTYDIVLNQPLQQPACQRTP
jgi:hypothetical protein